MAISKLNSGIYNHKEIPVTYEIVLNSGGIIYKMYKPSEMQKLLLERLKNPNCRRYKSWKYITEEGEIDRSKIMRAPKKLNKPQEKEGTESMIFSGDDFIMTGRDLYQTIVFLLIIGVMLYINSNLGGKD